MSLNVAIIAPGEMGAAVGARLAERGVRVTTSLTGRSGASAARAERASMVSVDDDDVLVRDADFVLSIVPPGDAIRLAGRLAPALARADRKPIYVDCNAIAPDTAEQLGVVLADTGCRYVDGGIIGPPPQPNSTSTRIYVSGPAASEVARLNDVGLSIRPLTGPIGAASALKMSYAGITKGFTAVGAAMAIGASRAGCAEGLACRTRAEPAAASRLALTPGAAHVSEGLSLGRGNGGDRSFPGRRLAVGRNVRGCCPALFRACRSGKDAGRARRSDRAVVRFLQHERRRSGAQTRLTHNFDRSKPAAQLAA